MARLAINYNLRPAKHIERKMLCEAFRRLSEIASVESLTATLVLAPTTSATSSSFTRRSASPIW